MKTQLGDARICLFIGTRRGLTVLESLVKANYQVAAVLVLAQQSHEIDNCTGSIIAFCKKHKIPNKTSLEITSSGYYEFLLFHKPTIVFAISWRFLIPDTCFEVPSRGIFIIHDSLLPRYRGASPTNWVIINGEKETGLSLQYISRDVDAGDLVDQIKVSIDPEDDAKTLNDKLTILYPKIILKNITAIINKKNKRLPQNHELATFACRRSPEDGKISFTEPTHKTINLIKGLTYPYPGSFCYYSNEKVIIWQATQLTKIPKYEGHIPGKIISVTSEYVDVLTNDGILRILKIGLPSEPNVFLKPNSVLKSISQTLR